MAQGSARGYDNERLCHGETRDCYTEQLHEETLAANRFAERAKHPISAELLSDLIAAWGDRPPLADTLRCPSDHRGGTA